MTTEAITDSTFIREYTRELRNMNAAVFAGAGLSLDSGYVDWKGLLKNIITDLGLDPTEEYDLVTLAQYHCNQAGGNKSALTQTIFDCFAQTKRPTENHRILARMPIHTYWTTNYDKLIETALVEAKKVPDTKYTLDHLAVTRPDRDVVVYKMHGDVDHASKAVISKDDYEAYPLKMSTYVSALRGDLIEKTFLFLGFSFSDPNIDYILSRVRVQYEQHQRHHYCIQKRVSQEKDEPDVKFKIRQLKQNYFIRDLKRFGIQTVLVDTYSEITLLLQKVADRYKQGSIFVSGAASVYGKWGQSNAETFLHKLSYQIASSKRRIITGFGLGVGAPIINGALAYLNDVGQTISDEHIVMRPFPQVATGGKNLPDQWTDYRKAMIEYAGIGIFVFGNKLDDKGAVVLSNGMRQEFDLCVAQGIFPIPIGATGYMAETLWNEVLSNFKKHYPAADAEFLSLFESLGDSSKHLEELLVTIQKLIDRLHKN